MLYMINGAQGEDDGSAWEYRPDGSKFSRVQVRPLSITLLQAGLRVLAVGADIIVDSAMAVALARLVQGLDEVARPAIVRGPQPELLQQPEMVQLGALAQVQLAEISIARNADGQIARLLTPFVLNANGRTNAAGVCKIAENGLTLVSQQVKQLLAAAEPRLTFKAVRFEDEAAESESSDEPFRMPSAAELKKMKGR